MTPFLDSELMEPQIANLISITRQLSDLKFLMTDNWVTGLIKVKLPASWETLKTILTNTEEGKLTSKGVIAQVLAEEHHRIHEAGGDATAYYAKSSGKGKKKKDNGKKCSHCKRKGHNVSECHMLKQEQEEKASRLTTLFNSPSGKSSGRSSGKYSGKSSGKASKSLPHNGSSSAKIATTESDSDSGSDDTV